MSIPPAAGAVGQKLPVLRVGGCSGIVYLHHL